MAISNRSDQLFFFRCVHFANLRKFSPIFIPEIAKTKKVDFSKPLTANGFLTLSGINIGVY
jgi:hypothetical protein